MMAPRSLPAPRRLGTGPNDAAAGDHNHAGTGGSIVYKTSQETRFSEATLSNDNTLKWTVAPGQVFAFQAMLIVEGTTTSDIKVGWSVPSSTTMTWGGIGPQIGNGGTGNEGTNYRTGTEGTTQSYGTGGGTRMTIMLGGIVIAGVGSGTVNLQWCQDSSEANLSYVHAGSYLIAWRIT